MRLWFVIVLMTSVSANAAEIYRWTDENGQVHYGERPPDDRAQPMDIPTESSSAPRLQSDETARRARQQRLLEAYEYERARKAERAALAANKASQLAVQCERLRNQWRRLNFGGPVYFQGEDGERRYLDEDQRTAEKNRLRPAYREACGTSPE
jgi:hypothetical protein